MRKSKVLRLECASAYLRIAISPSWGGTSFLSLFLSLGLGLSSIEFLMLGSGLTGLPTSSSICIEAMLFWHRTPSHRVVCSIASHQHRDPRCDVVFDALGSKDKGRAGCGELKAHRISRSRYQQYYPIECQAV